MKKFFLLNVLLVITLIIVGCNGQEEGEKRMDTNKFIEAENIGQALISKQFNELYNQFGEGLKGIVAHDQFEELGNQFIEGEAEFELVSSSKINGYIMNIWQNNNQDKGILASVSEAGIIDGFLLTPIIRYAETDKLKSDVEYILPFRDEWYVYWGGKDPLLNYHYEYEHMRYAYDFIKVVDDYSYNGDPSKNESYFAFDQEVIAPAKGTIINVVDGIPDNVPGEMNEKQAEGNMIIIEHEHGEFSMLAHFKQNSILVKEGDIVEAGQLLGRSGNSGNSSEAHIHFQVSKVLENGEQIIVPVSFSNGQEWIKGDYAIQ